MVLTKLPVSSSTIVVPFANKSSDIPNDGLIWINLGLNSTINDMTTSLVTLALCQVSLCHSSATLN